jgi:hypothetical protein
VGSFQLRIEAYWSVLHERSRRWRRVSLDWKATEAVLTERRQLRDRYVDDRTLIRISLFAAFALPARPSVCSLAPFLFVSNTPRLQPASINHLPPRHLASQEDERIPTCDDYTVPAAVIDTYLGKGFRCGGFRILRDAWYRARSLH